MEEHTHTHEHHHEHGHDHPHHHEHTHTHDPKEVKAIVNRMSRSIGHYEKVKKMFEEGEDCSDVLIQLAAVKAELNGIGKTILKEHMEHCIIEAVEEGDTDSIARMNDAIDKFMK